MHAGRQRLPHSIETSNWSADGEKREDHLVNYHLCKSSQETQTAVLRDVVIPNANQHQFASKDEILSPPLGQKKSTVGRETE